MVNVFATKSNLRSASRLPTLSGEAGVTAAEIACLCACGAAAALAVGFLQFHRGIPGHAILRGVLPMALGLAIVPRRSAGIMMALAGALTATAMNWGHVGWFPPAALASIICLGPVLDLALAGRPQGWKLYLRFALAGAVANLLAFTVRFSMAYYGWQTGGGGGGGGNGGGGGGGREFMSFWSLALGSFILCGALAGLVSAAIWFRLQANKPR